MRRNAWKDTANWRIKGLNSCIKSLHHVLTTISSKKEELETVGELSKVCSQIFLKCQYLVRIGRPDIPWSVNKLARAVATWTPACGRRLARLISYIHFTVITANFAMWAMRLNNLDFVPVILMCKKQTSVSHSSAESDVISLDAGLRMDGTPALVSGIWFFEVSHSSTCQPSIQGNLCLNEQ